MMMIAMVLTSACAMAQHEVGTLTLQPKAGVSLANLTGDSGDKMRVGLVAGLEAEYQVADIVSVSLGALYSMQGTKGSQKHKFTLGGNVYDLDLDGTIKLDYINVPLLCNVYVAPGLAVKVGVQPGFCINKKYDFDVKVSGVDEKTREIIEKEVEKDFDHDLDGVVKAFDLSIPVGISYEYANFQLDARYNWGVTKVYKEAKGNNSVIQVTLGYKFAL